MWWGGGSPDSKDATAGNPFHPVCSSICTFSPEITSIAFTKSLVYA